MFCVRLIPVHGRYIHSIRKLVHDSRLHFRNLVSIRVNVITRINAIGIWLTRKESHLRGSHARGNQRSFFISSDLTEPSHGRNKPRDAPGLTSEVSIESMDD